MGGFFRGVPQHDRISQFVICKQLAVTVVYIPARAGNTDFSFDAELEIVHVALAVYNLKIEKAHDHYACRTDNSRGDQQDAQIDSFEPGG